MCVVLVPYFIVVSLLISNAATDGPLILTSLINQGRTQDARNYSLVDPQYFLGVKSHAGFLTVDKEHDSNTFFWYFPVKRQLLNETPWVVWLQGGPGGSSLTGVFDEMGPFEYSGGVLKTRKSSWCNSFSMVFIDNPVGAGYSFTRSPQGYAKSMAMYSDHLYVALQQFLTVFPELRHAPLYLAGESYAGHYVPAFAAEIHKRAVGDSTVNLKGLILGNPVIDRSSIANYTSVFYNWGLIDDEALEALQPLEAQFAVALKKQDYHAAYMHRDTLLDELLRIAHQPQRYNILEDDLSFDSYVEYLKKPDVASALHVGNEQFDFLNHQVSQYLDEKEFFANMTPVVTKLLENYKLLIYCGQLDLVSPCVPSAHAHRNWNWSRHKDFLAAPRQPWLNPDETVAGYTKSGGGFTEVLVRGSGHLAPIDKPDQIYALIKHYIMNESLKVEATKLTSYQTATEQSKADSAEKSNNYRALFLTSLIVNAVLIFFVVFVIMYCRRLRRSDGWQHFTAVDDFEDHSDGVLSLS